MDGLRAGRAHLHSRARTGRSPRLGARGRRRRHHHVRQRLPRGRPAGADNDRQHHAGRARDVQLPGRARTSVAQRRCSRTGPKPTSCIQTAAPRAAGSSRRRRCRRARPGPGLGGLLHVQGGRHVHVLLPAARGHGGHRRRDGHPTPTPTADADRDRDADADRDADGDRRRATATPAGPRIEARDGGGPPAYWWQDTSNPTPRDSSVTITAGERVTFAYPTGSNLHNVAFDGRRRRRPVRRPRLAPAGRSTPTTRRRCRRRSRTGAGPAGRATAPSRRRDVHARSARSTRRTCAAR